LSEIPVIPGSADLIPDWAVLNSRLGDTGICRQGLIWGTVFGAKSAFLGQIEEFPG
jgi:hypothetical protein